jgi:hypothetical protein
MDQQPTTIRTAPAHDASADDVAGHALILAGVAAATFLAATNPFVQGYLLSKAVK